MVLSQPLNRVLLPLACAGVTLLSACTPPERPQTPGTFALVGATVIDGTGAAPKPNQTVVVSGGRIAAVGDSADVSIPPGARSIDATGQFLIPGLWDLHVHTRPEALNPKPTPVDEPLIRQSSWERTPPRGPRMDST